MNNDIDYSQTYWNGKGKHEKLREAVSMQVPYVGTVENAKSNPALEKYRIAGNCYYDLYNNGLCNQAQEFRKVFGFSATKLTERNRGLGYKLTQEIIDLTETRMDEIILAAYAEQFPPERDAETPQNKFTNYYECSHVDTTGQGEKPSNWQDDSANQNNDRCPICDSECEPSYSEDIDTQQPADEERQQYDALVREGACVACGRAKGQHNAGCPMWTEESLTDKIPPHASPSIVDITPAGFNVPSGAARIMQTTNEYQDATVQVANAAETMYYEMLAGGEFEDWTELSEAIQGRKEKQEAFLRAVAGRPEPIKV